MIKLIAICLVFFGVQVQASECLARLKVNGQVSRAQSDNLLPTRINVSFYCDQETPTIEAGMLYFVFQASRDGVRWTDAGSGVIEESGDAKKDHFILLSKFPAAQYRVRAKVFFSMRSEIESELVAVTQVVKLSQIRKSSIPKRKR